MKIRYSSCLYLQLIIIYKLTLHKNRVIISNPGVLGIVELKNNGIFSQQVSYITVNFMSYILYFLVRKDKVIYKWRSQPLI